MSWTQLLKTGSQIIRKTAAASASALPQRRSLHLHEYHCHALMKKFGINTPKSGVAFNSLQAEKVARSLAVKDVVIKAQVLAGGRGRGSFDNGLQGGVHVLDGIDQVGDLAEKMIGARLITKQTGVQGLPCNAVLLVERLKIKKEFYFAILMDRQTFGPVVVVSSQGGMNIEEVAARDPSAILKFPVPLEQGLTLEVGRDIAQKLGIPAESLDSAANQFQRLYQLFIAHDASMVEINPLALDEHEKIVCMDAKFNFDENAKFRQPDIFQMRDTSQESAAEVKASQFDLNYIELDGSIGCLVNGAGLAMATMDIIQFHGGKPANFLDVGGGATAKQVMEAFKIITSEPDVACILVNIFGGIMRCDVIAEGIINATAQLELRVPVVVRLAGTRVEEAKKLISHSKLDILTSEDLDDAALRAVECAKIVKTARGMGLLVAFKEIKSLVNEDEKQVLPVINH